MIKQDSIEGQASCTDKCYLYIIQGIITEMFHIFHNIFFSLEDFHLYNIVLVGDYKKP
jgi:hypothetical protein